MITVKGVPAVPVPPSVITEIETAPGFSFGTIAVICVPAVFTVKLALLPSNITAVAPASLAPLIVTDEPLGPLAGAKLVIAGGATTVKMPALVAVPPGVVIAMGPLAAPAGTTAVIRRPLLLMVNVALVPANVTLVVPLRFWPLIVTSAPAPPLCGEKLVIVGREPLRTVKLSALTAVPSGLVTAIVPLVAPTGTTARI